MRRRAPDPYDRRGDLDRSVQRGAARGPRRSRAQRTTAAVARLRPERGSLYDLSAAIGRNSYDLNLGSPYDVSAAFNIYLRDPRIPVDNNQSENALRVVALGRKNFLFVGDLEGGENLAVLFSLVATCEANGINPHAYLADVLLRVQTHPASRIDELLPDRWTRIAS